MHELSITRSLIAIVAEKASGRRVLRVKLELGRLCGLVPESLRFCFDLCAQGTSVDGAHLEILDVAGRGQCCACGGEHPLQMPIGCCPGCGSPTLKIVAGEELNILEMEVL